MLLEIPIGPNDAGQRADRFLRKYLIKLNSGKLNSLFRRDEIKIYRKPIERGKMLVKGDVLQVYGLKPEESVATKTKEENTTSMKIDLVSLPIIFEDEDLLVVNKPSGLVAHPGTGVVPGASLIEKAQAYLRQNGLKRWHNEVFVPSLVHRLDKETSGIILIAKTGSCLRQLSEALREGKIRKRYVALVIGHTPPSGVIDAPLEREDSATGAKIQVVDSGGKRSVTRYKTVKKVGPCTLLQVIIETGRMHQIRAHLAHLGFPVAGDTRYGRPSEVRLQMKSLGLRRLFLHSEETAWDELGSRRLFTAPLPADLQSVLDSVPSPSRKT